MRYMTKVQFGFFLASVLSLNLFLYYSFYSIDVLLSPTKRYSRRTRLRVQLDRHNASKEIRRIFKKAIGRDSKKIAPVKKAKNTKVILLWDVPFESDFGLVAEFLFADHYPNNLETFIIDSEQCGRCKITYDRNEFANSSAIIFHRGGNGEFPGKSNKDQRYIWWSQESSYNEPVPNYRYVYDWIMSVNPYADVYSPYSSFPWVLKFIRWKDENKMDIMEYMARSRYIPIRRSRKRKDDSAKPDASAYSRKMDARLKSLLKSKTRLALWISSNCRTEGADLRYEIAERIRNAGLKVERYGSCFDRAFPVENRWDPEFHKEISRYKFYLSFENSFHCRGYFTEKMVYNAMYSGTVPVIYGPHKSDIEKMFPPKSYIHIEDFKSAEDLVSYLKYLHSNNTAYAEYLQWRTWTKYLDRNGDYSSGTLNDLPQSLKPSATEKSLLDMYAKPKAIGFCHLCSKLHNSKTQTIQKLKGVKFNLKERAECTDINIAWNAMSTFLKW